MAENTRQAANGTQTLEQETVNELVQAGYEAYNITSSNYSEIEDALQTDLASMGIDPDGSYIVVVSGENFGGCENAGVESKASGVQPTATSGSSFEYTYDERTYTLRYLTITAADNPYYGQASSSRIIGENTPDVLGDVLANLLNTGISVFLDEINDSILLGTIASICGLEPVDFGTSQTAFNILDLYAGTNWTRIFTQIWVESENRWVSQLHVEYAKLTSYFAGMFYKAGVNSYEPVPANRTTQMIYSAHLDDRTWRIEQAIIGFKIGKIYYDLVGNAVYMFNNRPVIIHKEAF